MRVAEDAARRVPPHLLGHPGVWVRIFTERKIPAIALRAGAAGDRERYDDAVADRKIADSWSDFHDFAHELVTENVPSLHRWDEPVVQMGVGTADGRARDTDDGIARVENLWIRNVFDVHAFGAVPA